MSVAPGGRNGHTICTPMSQRKPTNAPTTAILPVRITILEPVVDERVVALVDESGRGEQEDDASGGDSNEDASDRRGQRVVPAPARPQRLGHETAHRRDHERGQRALTDDVLPRRLHERRERRAVAPGDEPPEIRAGLPKRGRAEEYPADEHQ